MEKAFHLIQHTFSTILLDAIQYFPQNIKSEQAEAHGILFGMSQGNEYEYDYVFPVGNVTERKEDEVAPNSKVDEAIRNAK